MVHLHIGVLVQKVPNPHGLVSRKIVGNNVNLTLGRLVRHDFLRQQPNLADLQVDLQEQDQRTEAGQ